MLERLEDARLYLETVRLQFCIVLRRVNVLLLHNILWALDGASHLRNRIVGIYRWQLLVYVISGFVIFLYSLLVERTCKLFIGRKK